MTDLEKFKTPDLYSILLFSLYKLTDNPECSSLSELAYVLDKENLLNLCEFFGGQTIQIPTITELENWLKALHLFYEVKVEKHTISDVMQSLSSSKDETLQIKRYYRMLVEVVNDYDFPVRD